MGTTMPWRENRPGETFLFRLHVSSALLAGKREGLQKPHEDETMASRHYFLLGKWDRPSLSLICITRTITQHFSAEVY